MSLTNGLSETPEQQPENDNISPTTTQSGSIPLLFQKVKALENTSARSRLPQTLRRESVGEDQNPHVHEGHTHHEKSRLGTLASNRLRFCAEKADRDGRSGEACRRTAPESDGIVKLLLSFNSGPQGFRLTDGENRHVVRRTGFVCDSGHRSHQPTSLSV